MVFVIDDLIGIGMVAVELYAEFGPFVEAYQAAKAGRKAIKAGVKAFSWAKAESKLSSLESKLEALKTFRPGDFGHPECMSPSPAQAPASA